MDRPEQDIYMNNAATAWPRAPGVAQAVQDAMSDLPEHPGRAATGFEDALTACRSRLAKLFKVSDPNQIILTTCATMSLNVAIGGLQLKSGDLAVTTVTEHNSMLRPLAHAQDRGVAVDIVGMDETGAIDRAALEQKLEQGPRLVALNHVSNVTGRIQDVGPLFALAKSAGAVTLLDVSQSLGHAPVHPQDLNVDLVAFTGHKGLRGPTGTGGLYVSPELELEPIIVGGTGVRSDLSHQPRDMPTRLEAGTPNLPAFAGLATALDWCMEHGRDCADRELELHQRLRAGLEAIDDVTVFGHGPWGSGIVSFHIRGWSVEEAGFILHESFGIHCRTGLHCAPLIHEAIGAGPEGTIRFSLSGFSEEAHVDAAVAAVENLTVCAS